MEKDITMEGGNNNNRNTHQDANLMISTASSSSSSSSSFVSAPHMSNGGKLTVNVRASERIFPLNEVDPTITVRTLKELIQKEHPDHPPVSVQKLIFAGRIMDDTKMLSSFLSILGNTNSLSMSVHLIVTSNLASSTTIVNLTSPKYNSSSSSNSSNSNRNDTAQGFTTTTAAATPTARVTSTTPSQPAQSQPQPVSPMFLNSANQPAQIPLTTGNFQYVPIVYRGLPYMMVLPSNINPALLTSQQLEQLADAYMTAQLQQQFTNANPSPDEQQLPQPAVAAPEAVPPPPVINAEEVQRRPPFWPSVIRLAIFVYIFSADSNHLVKIDALIFNSILAFFVFLVQMGYFARIIPRIFRSPVVQVVRVNEEELLENEANQGNNSQENGRRQRSWPKPIQFLLQGIKFFVILLLSLFPFFEFRGPTPAPEAVPVVPAPPANPNPNPNEQQNPAPDQLDQQQQQQQPPQDQPHQDQPQPAAPLVH